MAPYVVTIAKLPLLVLVCLHWVSHVLLRYNQIFAIDVLRKAGKYESLRKLPKPLDTGLISFDMEWNL